MHMLLSIVCDHDLAGDEGFLPRAVGTVNDEVVMPLFHRAPSMLSGTCIR